MLDVIERRLVLYLEVEIGTRDLLFEHSLGIFEGNTRLDIGGNLSHSFFHVYEVGFLTQLLVNILFVGLGWQDLLDFVEERDVMVQHLMDRLEGELDHILDVRPLMLLLKLSRRI